MFKRSCPPPCFDRAFPPGVLDQDAAHRFCRRKKISPSLPILTAFAHQPQPRLMHQRRWLERVPGRFVQHSGGRQIPQLIVNQRQQFFSGLTLAFADGVQNQRDVAHAGRLPDLRTLRLWIGTDRFPAIKIFQQVSYAHNCRSSERY